MACLPRKVILKIEVDVHECVLLAACFWPPLLFLPCGQVMLLAVLCSPKKEGRPSTLSLSTPCFWIDPIPPGLAAASQEGWANFLVTSRTWKEARLRTVLLPLRCLRPKDRERASSALGWRTVFDIFILASVPVRPLFSLCSETLGSILRHTKAWAKPGGAHL